jgi:hypothetical protein
MRGTSTRARAVVAATGLVAALIVGTTAGPADAATVRAFKNCTAMHKVAAFKGGIAKPGARDRRTSGHAKYAPYRSLKGYRLNAKSDRDKDGVACEQ